MTVRWRADLIIGYGNRVFLGNFRGGAVTVWKTIKNPRWSSRGLAKCSAPGPAYLPPALDSTIPVFFASVPLFRLHTCDVHSSRSYVFGVLFVFHFFRTLVRPFRFVLLFIIIIILFLFCWTAIARSTFYFYLFFLKHDFRII